MDSIRMQDIHITFEEIDRAEKKAIEKTKEADIIQQAAVDEWNKVFEAMMKLMESYHASKTFQSSKMGELFRVWDSSKSEKEMIAFPPAYEYQSKWFDEPEIPDIRAAMTCQKCGRTKTHHRLYGYKCDNPDCADENLR